MVLLVFLGLLKHLQETFPKGSATQSGHFAKNCGNPPGLETARFSFSQGRRAGVWRPTGPKRAKTVPRIVSLLSEGGGDRSLRHPLCPPTQKIKCFSKAQQKQTYSIRPISAANILQKKNLIFCFWQNGFFAGFLFLSRRIFFRGFCCRILSPHFCGKKSPEESSRKVPDKILQIIYNKNPRQFSAEGPCLSSLAQFYSKNGPPKSAPKFCAHFLLFCSPQIFFISPKRAKNAVFSFETGPQCRQQIGVKANLFVNMAIFCLFYSIFSEGS